VWPMKAPEPKKTAIESAGQDLFNFAIEREDIKWLMTRLPRESDARRATVEYELQILKIIAVGWSLSYHLENSPLKEPLSAFFWEAVRGYAQNLSDTTGLMIGQEIDYFQVLKDRLEMYVQAMNQKPGVAEPAEIIGPQFAGLCGRGDDIFTFMTGSKMFISTVTRVREYLEALKLR